jgi:8-oxo-dGTP diphosphatase
MEKISNKRGYTLLNFSLMESEDQINPEIHKPLDASLVVAINNDRVLLVFDRYKQCWETPGGRIETGEKPRVCAGRELMEESGQSVDNLFFIGLVEICLKDDNRIFAAVYAGWLGGILPFQANNEIEKTILWDYVTDIGYVDEIDNYIACVGKQGLQKLLR